MSSNTMCANTISGYATPPLGKRAELDEVCTAIVQKHGISCATADYQYTQVCIPPARRRAVVA